MTCEEVRLLAPEAALEVLDGASRAEVLDHIAACAGCRAELAALAAAADVLLEVVPPSEAPPGFESRVLARLASERPTALRRARPSWWLPAAAAVVAAVLGVGGGLALRGGSSDGDGVIAARLIGADGRAVGQVLVSDDPDRMVCVLDGAPEGVRYAVSITADGDDADVGTFTSRGPGQPWATDLPVDGADVRRVVVRDADGAVRAWAELPG